MGDRAMGVPGPAATVGLTPGYLTVQAGVRRHAGGLAAGRLTIG
jgi:hypothetical protein